jgi:diaminopropionate ammonia-lyase
MRAFVNPAFAPSAVAAPSDEALAFHRGLAGYAPSPLRDLGGGVWLKDESNRLGLPAFKVLGVSWAVERALRLDPHVKTLVAASAGNHGRAVAHVAAARGLSCRIYLPARSVPARRSAIEAEGADVVVVDGTYEDAVQLAQRYAEGPDVVELADVGSSPSASWVIDGYATLFSEIGDDSARGLASLGALAEGLGLPPGEGTDARFDVVLVPIGVGSLGAAAARWGAAVGTTVIGVEPDVAACLTAALVAGEPTVIDTPGTAMAGLDCAVVSVAAWDALQAGIGGTITVSDAETGAAMRELARLRLAIGDSGAAPLAALHALRTDPACAALRAVVSLDRVLLIATEGPTDPAGYAATVA